MSEYYPSLSTIQLVTTPARDITTLLRAWRHGDRDAADRLAPLVYDQLRQVARGYLRRERGDGLLESRVLVHEAYVRLVEGADVDWKDRTHFFAIAARIMRRILIDAARARASAKRGGELQRVDQSSGVNFDAMPAPRTNTAAQWCALDDALSALAELDPRRSQVVELRFFGGLSVEETAAVLRVSPQTVMRDWKLARAWLARTLNR
jgi:RNA polymerase sigma factor (TIGR02999 family)